MNDALGLRACGVGREGELAVGDALSDDGCSEPARVAELARDGNATPTVSRGILLQQPGALAIKLNLDAESAMIIDDSGLGNMPLIDEGLFFHVHQDRLFTVNRHRLISIGAVLGYFQVQTQRAEFVFPFTLGRSTPSCQRRAEQQN